MIKNQLFICKVGKIEIIKDLFYFYIKSLSLANQIEDEKNF